MSEQPIKLFISHASEDKEAFVKGLAAALSSNAKFDVWYDEYSLRLGDSLLQSIGKGLRSCDYGIVVLSLAFFSKQWPANELAGLFALEKKERKTVLPIWHNVTHEQVLEFNPILADRFAVPSTKPLDEIVFAIEAATWGDQKAKELANPNQEKALELKNQILDRQITKQLSNSFEGGLSVSVAIPRLSLASLNPNRASLRCSFPRP
jgi:TIR domain